MAKRLDNVDYFKALKEKILMYGQFQIAVEQRQQNIILIILAVGATASPFLVEALHRFLGF